jgi:hypothetical protein
MTRSRYGMIAGIAGAAFAAWWWNRQRTAGRASAGRKGEVIFHNHPVVTNEGVL